MRTNVAGDPIGLHRVLDQPRVLPQAARRLDTRPEIWPDEVRIRVERLNLDAASFRQLERTHTGDDGRVDRDALRAEVLAIVAERLAQDERLRESLPLGVDFTDSGALTGDLDIVREAVAAALRDLDTDEGVTARP